MIVLVLKKNLVMFFIFCSYGYFADLELMASTGALQIDQYKNSWRGKWFGASYIKLLG